MDVSSFLIDKDVREALKKIVEYEEMKEKEYSENEIFKGLDMKPYWTWQDVGIHWSIVQKLLLAGIVKATGGRKKEYLLASREEVKKALEESEAFEATEERKLEEIKLPDDFLDIVEGFDDLKKFIKLSLTAEKPVHILLIGPPGCAKSLILMEIERLGARFITAGTATKVGIRDVLFDETPRIFIIDEIEKIQDSKDFSAILTWMQDGRIIITRHGLTGEKRGMGLVFGACNTERGLPPELLDRFQKFYIKPYTPEQYRRIVSNYLTKRCNVNPELASYIAEKVGEYTTSVREAIRISRIAKTKEDVDELISIIQKYSKED